MELTHLGGLLMYHPNEADPPFLVPGIYHMPTTRRIHGSCSRTSAAHERFLDSPTLAIVTSYLVAHS